MYSEYQSIVSVGCERSQPAAACALLLAYCLFCNPSGVGLESGESDIDRLPRAPVSAARLVRRLDAKAALGESSKHLYLQSELSRASLKSLGERLWAVTISLGSRTIDSQLLNTRILPPGTLRTVKNVGDDLVWQIVHCERVG